MKKTKDNTTRKDKQNKARNTAEARAVAEFCKGRELRPEEVVHHVDFNHANNDPNNLAIFKDASNHSETHAQMVCFEAWQKERLKYLSILEKKEEEPWIVAWRKRRNALKIHSEAISSQYAKVASALLNPQKD